MCSTWSMKRFNGRDTLLRVRDGKPIRTRSTASLPDQVYTPNRICSQFLLRGLAARPFIGMERGRLIRVRFQATSAESRSLALAWWFLRVQGDLGFQFRECLSPACLLAQLLIVELFLIHFRFSR